MFTPRIIEIILQARKSAPLYLVSILDVMHHRESCRSSATYDLWIKAES